MGRIKAVSNISNRADKQIHEYQEVSLQQGLHGWDPRLKLALLVIAVAINIVFAHLWLSLILFLISLILVILSGIPWRLFALFFSGPGLGNPGCIFGLFGGFWNHRRLDHRTVVLLSGRYAAGLIGGRQSGM